ncbi:copia protein [Tanacetum coccineum]
MAQENCKSSGRYTNHHHKEDPKIALKDSWNDSSKDEHEESYPMAAGSQKGHRNHLSQEDSWNANVTNNEVELKPSTIYVPYTYHKINISECNSILNIEYMHDKFKMNKLGDLKSILNLQITQGDNGIFISESKYLRSYLKRFDLENAKSIKTPMSTDLKLTLDKDGVSVDSSKYRYHAGYYVNRKSTSGVCTLVGECLTQWCCKKQTALAISTTEAEYVAVRRACQQALRMKQAIKTYDTYCKDILVLYDNKGAIDLSKNPVHHSRTKHIKIRHHSLRDNVQKGNILMEKVASEDNIADILTKPLKRKTFNYLRLGLGMLKHE